MFGVKTPQKRKFFGGENRRFKSNLQNFQTATSLKRFTWNFNTDFRSQSRLRGWSLLQNSNSW